LHDPAPVLWPLTRIYAISCVATFNWSDFIWCHGDYIAGRVRLTHTGKRVFGLDGQVLFILTLSFLSILPCKCYIHIPPCSPYIMTCNFVERFIFSTVDTYCIFIRIIMALPAHSGPWPLIQFRNHFSQTVGLFEWVISSSQGLYLNTGQHKHRINAYTHQTSMPWVGFEPTIPASERAKAVHAWDRAAAVTGTVDTTTENNQFNWVWFLSFTIHVTRKETGISMTICTSILEVPSRTPACPRLFAVSLDLPRPSEFLPEEPVMIIQFRINSLLEQPNYHITNCLTGEFEPTVC
jgi:hypothetical protein